MKIKLAATCFVIGTVLAPAVMYAADADTTRPSAATVVKDSVITTKIKSKLAVEHLSSIKNIKVDTDSNGVVWLSGVANTQAEADKIVSVARGTEGVTSVKSDIVVRSTS